MKPIKISASKYRYRNYILNNVGYYPPEGCICWEAINISTGCADHFGKSKRELINNIKSNI